MGTVSPRTAVCHILNDGAINKQLSVSHLMLWQTHLEMKTVTHISPCEYLYITLP